MTTGIGLRGSCSRDMLASTTAALPDVRDEIEALLSWNPPRLIPVANKKELSSTRPPSFYDKHFSQNLVLLRVEHLPSLVPALANNVDKALHAASGTLPPPNGLITAQRRTEDVGNLDVRVADEKAVADFYNQTTAKYCSPLASTLALHPTASFFAMDQSLVLDAIGSFLGVSDYGRGASFLRRKWSSDDGNDTS
jgi:hypothetical protein